MKRKSRFWEGNGDVRHYLAISVRNFESSLHPLPYGVTVCHLYILFTYYTHLYFVFFSFCQKYIFTCLLYSPRFCFFFSKIIVFFRKLRYSSKFWTVKEVTCSFLCKNSKEKCWNKLRFWNSNFKKVLQF